MAKWSHHKHLLEEDAETKRDLFAKFKDLLALFSYKTSVWFWGECRVPRGDKQPLLLPIYAYLRLKGCQDPTCQSYAHNSEKIKH